MHTHARVGLPPGGSLGRIQDSWRPSCLVSVGAAGEGQGRVPDVCLCGCSTQLRAPWGWWGVKIPMLPAHGSEARSMAGCPSSPRGGAACLTVPGCLYAVPGHLHGVESCAVPGWARVTQGPGLWLLATWVGGTQPACSCPPHPADLPPCPRI